MDTTLGAAFGTKITVLSSHSAANDSSQSKRSEPMHSSVSDSELRRALKSNTCRTRKAMSHGKKVALLQVTLYSIQNIFLPALGFFLEEGSG